LSDFLSATFEPAWPSEPLHPRKLAGHGRIRTATGAVPAVGVDISDVVPSGAVWLLYSIEAALVTSAAVANRTVNLFIDDAQSTVTRRVLLTDTTAQTATQTRTHAWYPGTDSISTASVSIVDGAITLLAKFPQTLLGGVLLNAGDKIRTTTALIDVADQWAAARYRVMEYIDIAA